MLTSRNLHRGSALITALLITAVAASIAVIMITQQRIAIHETQLALKADQTYLNLQGVTAWAVETLLYVKKQKFSSFGSKFPILMPTSEFYGAKISGIITDQQALFNLNSLINPTNQIYFSRLLKIIDTKLTTEQAIAISKAITDWLRPNNNADDIYLKYEPPYRAAHRLMASISELRLITGITPTLFQKLKPYITALPTTKNSINLTTAPVPILQMLDPKLSLDSATSIILCRKNNNFNTCAQKVNANLSSDVTTLISNYFLCHGSATLGPQTLTKYSLLYFTKNNDNKPTIQILWQSYQTL